MGDVEALRDRMNDSLKMSEGEQRLRDGRCVHCALLQQRWQVAPCVSEGDFGGEEADPVGVIEDDLADAAPEDGPDQDVGVQNQSPLDLHYRLSPRRASL